MVVPEIDLNNWPAIKAYHKRLRERPSIVRAVTEEFELFKAELERHKAAA
jgi:glutathione S-transferase